MLFTLLVFTLLVALGVAALFTLLVAAPVVVLVALLVPVLFPLLVVGIFALIFRQLASLNVKPFSETTYIAVCEAVSTKISFCAPSAKPVFILYPGLLVIPSFW